MKSIICKTAVGGKSPEFAAKANNILIPVDEISHAYERYGTYYRAEIHLKNGRTLDVQESLEQIRAKLLRAGARRAAKRVKGGEG